MFTLTWAIVVAIITDFCLVMCWYLSYTNYEDTPDPRLSFAQLVSLKYQFKSYGGQLRSDGPLIRRVVQAVSSGAADPQLAPDN